MGKSKISTRTRRLTMGAMFTALGVVLLWLGAVIEILDLSLAAIASFLTVLGVIELGGAFPWLVWVATSVLSLLLLPAKFPALVYLLFAGVYPMVKAIFERRHHILAWVLKLSFFNTALLVLIALCVWVLKLPDTRPWLYSDCNSRWPTARLYSTTLQLGQTDFAVICSKSWPKLRF